MANASLEPIDLVEAGLLEPRGDVIGQRRFVLEKQSAAIREQLPQRGERTLRRRFIDRLAHENLPLPQRATITAPVQMTMVRYAAGHLTATDGR